MKELVRRKYKNAPNYEPSNQFFAMGKHGFENKSYTSTFDVAVHLAISTFNVITEDDKPLMTAPISVSMIVQRLNLSEDRTNASRNKDNFSKVKNSIDVLEEAGTIKVRRFTLGTEQSDDSALFIVEQPMTKRDMFNKYNKKIGEKEVKSFNTIDYITFYNLLTVEKDSERINLMACYMAVANQIYRPEKISDEASFNWVNVYKRAVCWMAQDKIGELYAVKSRQTVSKHIQKLIDMELLASYKVVYKSHRSGQFNYYLSKYSERKALVESLVSDIDNLETHNIVHVIDVDEFIESEQVKNDTQNDSDAQVDEDSHLELQDEIASQNTTQVDAGDTSDVVTVETKPKINIEIAEFAKQFILEDENDEEDFFYLSGQQMMMEQA